MPYPRVLQQGNFVQIHLAQLPTFGVFRELKHGSGGTKNTRKSYNSKEIPHATCLRFINLKIAETWVIWGWFPLLINHSSDSVVLIQMSCLSWKANAWLPTSFLSDNPRTIRDFLGMIPYIKPIVSGHLTKLFQHHLVWWENSEKGNNQTIKHHHNDTSGWWFRPLWKNMKFSWDDYSQYMEK